MTTPFLLISPFPDLLQEKVNQKTLHHVVGTVDPKWHITARFRSFGITSFHSRVRLGFITFSTV
jgi:hypothetical protein